MNLLREYPDYSEWSRRANAPSPGKDAAPKRIDDVTEIPEEALDRAARQLSNALEADVPHRVRSAAPMFLERVAVDLLIAMGGHAESLRAARTKKVLLPLAATLRPKPYRSLSKTVRRVFGERTRPARRRAAAAEGRFTD